MMDDLDHMMAIMADAFDSHWGEAWTRRQLADSLVLPRIFYRLIGPDGTTPKTGLNVDTPEAVESFEAFKPAGFTLSRYVSGEEELLLIAVRPAHREQGLGRKLMKNLEKDARSRGAQRMFLEMRSNNIAERLYRACGYLPVGRRKEYYRLKNGSRLDAITFVLHLT